MAALAILSGLALGVSLYLSDAPPQTWAFLTLYSAALIYGRRSRPTLEED